MLDVPEAWSEGGTGWVSDASTSLKGRGTNLGAGRRDLLRDVGRRDDNLGQRDAVVRNKD